MIIYIPSHLEKTIPIVKQLSSMIQGYSEEYGTQDSLGSFDYYYTHYSSDAVKKFIELCLLREDYEEDYEDGYYDGMINYLTKLFYSVKGTLKVFQYMEEYLGIEFKTNTEGAKFKYSINEVQFEIEEVTTTDISVYISRMKDFLSALLYYGDLGAIIDTVNLIISEEISNNGTLGINRYKEFTVTEVYSEE